MDAFQKLVSSMRGTLAKSSKKVDILILVLDMILKFCPHQLRQDILMFILRIIRQFFPYQLRQFLLKHAQNLTRLLDPYIEVSISDNSGSLLKCNSTYAAVESYLTNITSKTAQRLKTHTSFGNQKILLKLDEEHETVADVFQGVTVWWSFSKTAAPPQHRSLFSSAYQEPEKKFFKLRFHRKYRELITVSYLGYVVEKGKEAQLLNRKRKLYTNCGDSYSNKRWACIPFQHPARFESLAMDPEKKKEIVEDLVMFSQSGDYYAHIGKPWKRGYLLYGPPGTGKSTMIAAMANLLGYDVYDLELTAVKNNIDLKKLLIDTKSKAIIVIEDIDCSLHLTGDRNKNTDDDKGKKTVREDDQKNVTLSGLLNFIDGIWSASGGERIIVFTTNHVDKLDTALLRSGRMDKHIQLSYCGFAGFKVFARNYLQMETHCLFEAVEELMKDVKITPADVAEHLMPRSPGEDAEKRLWNFVQALEALKKPASAKMEDKEKEGEEDVKESKGEVETGNIAKVE